MRPLMLLLGLVLLIVCVHAQSVAWSRLYLHANSRGFLPQVAAADPQGNLIVAGRYIHQDTAFNSVAIVKYAPNGDLLWTRTFGELSEAEYAEAIVAAPDGSFYLAITRANRDSLAFLQRWSANGDLLWSVQINLSVYDVIRQILVRSDGGAEVLHSFGSGGIGFARLRYDASGNLLLNNQYPAPFTLLRNRTPVGMLLLNANTTLIAYIDGEINEVLQGYSRTYLRAINNSGGTVYEVLFPLRTERWARADDGSLYLLGDYWDRVSQQMRLRLCRVNPANGALLGQWDLTAVAGDAIPDILAVERRRVAGDRHMGDRERAWDDNTAGNRQRHIVAHRHAGGRLPSYRGRAHGDGRTGATDWRTVPQPRPLEARAAVVPQRRYTHGARLPAPDQHRR
jgi:hypothetical protein